MPSLFPLMPLHPLSQSSPHLPIYTPKFTLPLRQLLLTTKQIFTIPLHPFPLPHWTHPLPSLLMWAPLPPSIRENIIQLLNMPNPQPSWAPKMKAIYLVWPTTKWTMMSNNLSPSFHLPQATHPVSIHHIRTTQPKILFLLTS